MDACAVGRAAPSSRSGCPGWRPNWTPVDCAAHGCCYDPHPSPDPHGFAWCFANTTASAHQPARMYVDIDYFVSTTAQDPLTPFIDQGWWGDDAECHRDHCCRKQDSRLVGTLPFPHNWVVNMTSNNAAAVLMPDNVTLVQFQPLVRCTAGSPIFALPIFLHYAMPTVPKNLSILGEGTWGAHGGSHLSSIGGTIRMGELLPSTGPVRHALKLMLWAAEYYWPGTSAASPCYRWPALACDGPSAHSWSGPTSPSSGNFYNGSNPNLKPGALLAVAPALAPRVELRTTLGAKMLAALTDYGGYLDDNTASNTGAFNVEGGVKEEVAAAYPGLSLDAGPGDAFYHDMVAIFRSLHVVQNSAPTSKGGGGAPRKPPAPPICT